MKSSISTLRKPRFSALLVAVGVLCTSGAAAAEGNGIKVGESRLHPYFDLEGRFDSAAAVVGAGAGSNGTKLVGDLVIHFRPGVKLESPPDANFVVQMNAALDYNLFTGFVDAGTRQQSRLQGNAALDLTMNRNGLLTVEVGDNFARSDRSATAVLGVGVMSLFNDAKLQLDIKPGGALEIDPSYHLTTEFFSPLFTLYTRPPNCPVGDASCDPNSVSGLNYLNHTFGLAGRWRFLPKTALVLDTSYIIRTYVNGGSGQQIGLLKTMVGLAGLITTHIATVLKIGWAQDVTTSSYSSIIAQAEVSYLVSESAQARLGYLRSADPVGGRFVTFGDDRIYLDGRVLVGGKLTLRSYLSFDNISFRAGGGNTARTDKNFTADAGADYEIKQWLTAGVGYVFTNRSSPAGATLNLTNFQRHEIYAKVLFIY